MGEGGVGARARLALWLTRGDGARAAWSLCPRARARHTSRGAGSSARTGRDRPQHGRHRRTGRSGAGRGLALRSELGLAPDDVVLGMVSALRPEKSHDVAIEAVRVLRERFPAVRLPRRGRRSRASRRSNGLRRRSAMRSSSREHGQTSWTSSTRSTSVSTLLVRTRFRRPCARGDGSVGAGGRDCGRRDPGDRRGWGDRRPRGRTAERTAGGRCGCRTDPGSGAPERARRCRTCALREALYSAAVGRADARGLRRGARGADRPRRRGG